MQQRPLLQPFEQRGAVRRRQHGVERVVAAQPRAAVRHREQVQIVIAENDGRGIAQCANAPQYLERIGAAIDQVAHEPERIAVRREFQER